MDHSAERLGRLDVRSPRFLDVVDSHTCGQPTRVILSGAPVAPGSTPLDAQACLARDADWVRRLAVLEPRGHRSMFAAALIPPVAADGHYGVVFMDANGYPDMCGHATIGVATTLLELGLVTPPEEKMDGRFSFGLLTPAGLLDLEATMRQGRCEFVAFRTPLAYFLASIPLRLDTGGVVQVDVAYGGQYYAFLAAHEAGLSVIPDAMDALVAAAAPIRRALAQQFDVVDARIGAVPEIGNIVWTDAPTGDAHARNVPVSKGNAFDRSPCGTATCARMAVLVANGTLEIGAPFVNQSILGTQYHGRAIAPHAGHRHGIIPEVRGSAWLTARSRLLLDPRDPLGMGYLIGGGAAVL